MASYETEHNLPPQPPSSTSNPSDPSSAPRYQRIDLSTFWSNYDQVDTSNVSNPNATPIPADLSALFRTGAEGYMRILLDRGGDDEPAFLRAMIETLQRLEEMPPRKVKGVGREFVDTLERVPKKSLKEADTCPICNSRFLDDSHPLVVRLPCHTSHIFDLECIEPWLKVQATCPMDRKELVKSEPDEEAKKAEEKKKKEEEEDGEWDEMYA